MALGFKESTDGEKGDFNRLNAEEKVKYIKENGWFKDGSFNIVASFEVYCYIGGQLDSKYEFFERALRVESEPKGPEISGLPIKIYYNGGVKIQTQEYSPEHGEKTGSYDLSIGETIEFSRERYIPFKETYRVILTDVKYGEMMDL